MVIFVLNMYHDIICIKHNNDRYTYGIFYTSYFQIRV